MPFESLAGRPAALGRTWIPVVAVLAVSGLWLGGRSTAERMAGPGGQGPLWVSESVLDEGRRLLVVIDQAGRHLAVYHVDAAAGTVTLKSTRDISWDLMVGDFNAQEPRPAALQKMLQLPAAAPR